MHIIRYSPDKKEEWNGFVSASRNGTFILLRDYMDYHENRFSDHSLMFYERTRLLAVLPAHSYDDVFYSHQGLTYAGVVLSHQVTAQQVMGIFKMLLKYLSEECNINRLIYRAIPEIYHSYPSAEDLYALFRFGAVLTERKLSSVILQENAHPFRKLRKRWVKTALHNNLVITENSDVASYWIILQEVLQSKYNTLPVHTQQEISYLMNLFPECIRLYSVLCRERQIAGVIVYETTQVAHIQYIAADEEGKAKGALDLLFDYLIHNRYVAKRYIDFGVSTESGGQVLNNGLLFQKEGFGARAVVYDTYEIEINKIKDKLV